MKNLILLTLLLVACGAAAQSLRVEYLEGEVLLAAGSGWKELGPGDLVAQTSRIRLGDDGFVELSQGAARLTVSQPGTYLVSSLVAASKKVASWQLGKVVGGKIKTAVAGESKTSAGVRGAAGVRADAAAGNVTVEWADEVESEALAQGRSLIVDKRYEEALAVLREGLAGGASDRDKNAYHYYLASAYSGQHLPSKALGELQQAEIGPQAPMYEELVLLKGQLLLESLAFDAALALFDEQLAQNPGGDFKQALWILSSFSYRGLGKDNLAREQLQKAVRLDSESELGQEASGLLSQL